MLIELNRPLSHSYCFLRLQLCFPPQIRKSKFLLFFKTALLPFVYRNHSTFLAWNRPLSHSYFVLLFSACYRDSIFHSHIFLLVENAISVRALILPLLLWRSTNISTLIVSLYNKKEDIFLFFSLNYP